MVEEKDQPPECDHPLEINARAANEVIQRFIGQRAMWCHYMLGHTAFTLVVGDHIGKGNLLMHFEACRHIAGPMTWVLQKPVMRGHVSRDLTKYGYEMRDDPAGFVVSSMTLCWDLNRSLAELPFLYQPELDSSRTQSQHSDAKGIDV